MALTLRSAVEQQLLNLHIPIRKFVVLVGVNQNFSAYTPILLLWSVSGFDEVCWYKDCPFPLVALAQ